jgi:hypothetical protein
VPGDGEGETTPHERRTLARVCVSRAQVARAVDEHSSGAMLIVASNPATLVHDAR